MDIFSQNNLHTTSAEFINSTNPYKNAIESIIQKSVSPENRKLFYLLLEPIFIKNVVSTFFLKYTESNIQTQNFNILDNKIPLFFERNHKFKYLKDILSNPFLKDHQISEFLELFSNIQKCFQGLHRFIYIYKYKRSRIYNTTDLCGDPIPINKSNRISITIFQNNTRYVFLLRELMKTIVSSLSHTMFFFSEPISCKNPYTNLPLNKSALYNIYFAIRFSSSLKMHELFHRFFIHEFNLHNFLLHSDEEIREEYLNSYLRDIEEHLKYSGRTVVYQMFHENKIMCLTIHRQFPENRLIEIMRPYIELYYRKKFSLKQSYTNHLSVVLKYALLRFIKYNRFFGRRISKRENVNGYIKRVYKFNDDHIEFALPVETNFGNSHLSYYSESFSIMIREIRESRKLKFLRVIPRLYKDSDDENEDTQNNNLRENDDDSSDSDDADNNENNENNEISDNETHNDSDSDNDNDRDNEISETDNNIVDIVD